MKCCVNLLSLAILQVHRTSKIHFFKWSTHQSIKSHKDAGAVSRLSIKSNEHDDPDASDTFNIEQKEKSYVELCITACDIRINKARRNISDAVLQSYLGEIYPQHGSLMWGKSES